MKNRALAKIVFASLLVALLFSGVAAKAAEPMRVQARLIWGTDDKESPDKNQTPVDATLARRLTNAFKWKYYFVVSHKEAEIPSGQMKELKMSDRCAVEVKHLADGRAEVKLFGEGKQISTITQSLREDWPLILSGNAKNDTAWAVVIQRLPPPAKDKPKQK